MRVPWTLHTHARACARAHTHTHTHTDGGVGRRMKMEREAQAERGLTGPDLGSLGRRSCRDTPPRPLTSGQLQAACKREGGNEQGQRPGLFLGMHSWTRAIPCLPSWDTWVGPTFWSESVTNTLFNLSLNLAIRSSWS